jgi:DNA gyrase subunit B
MREVIEQGHLYVAMPPLYSVLENKKRVYLLNDTDYSDYISKIICKKYKFFASGKERNTASAISKIMNVLNKFKFKLTELLEADGIDKQFIETAFAYKFQNQDCKDSEVGKFLKGLGELKATKNEDKTDVIFFGIFEGSYINIEFKEVMKYVSELVEYANKIKLPKDLDIVSIDAEFNQDLLLPSVKYDEVVTKCTPKSRVRLKGLGEMDSEELWNTTMSPTERNLIQVTIDDEDKAFSVMEDMLNSNSKYSDRRKVFLLKNQEKAEALN